MSRIDDLIQELCPDGVPTMSLGELLDYEQPGRYLVASTDYRDEYATPVLTAGQTFILGYTDEVEGVYSANRESPVLIFDDFTTAFKWVDFPFKAKSSAMKMLTLRAGAPALIRYIYFAMQCIGFEPQDHARHWIGKYSLFRIPVPPLEVQREIVRVLDKFTQLEAELEAELEARRVQYEHYRRELLSGGEAASGRMIPLGEIFEMRAGTHIKAVEISDEPTEEKPYPCYGGNGLRGYVSSYNYDESVIFVGRQGALCGNVHRAEGKIYATEHAVVVTPKVAVDMSWAFHKLTEMDLNQYKTKSAQPGLAVGRVKQVEAQYVPIVDQRRHGEVLDKLDTLVSDISIGLPAELGARREQYEYYRDRLLTFKELTS